MRAQRGASLPLAAKLAFTLFMIVHVPVDWAKWGLSNSLWVCEVSLRIQLVALWTESSLLTSVALVSTLLIQAVWTFDFASGLLLGDTLLDQTDYMFSSSHSPIVRGLSLYHAWAPAMLIWMLVRLGYDRRAWIVTNAVALLILLLSFAVDSDPGGGDGNLNFVLGPQWLSPALWLMGVWVMNALAVTLPAHLILQRLLPERPVPPG